mgnify:FL=1
MYMVLSVVFSTLANRSYVPFVESLVTHLGPVLVLQTAQSHGK